jgi:hypothetical protein
MRKPPYRFVAREGMYAGTTFVYPDEATIVSYNTENPLTYFVSPAWRPDGPVPIASAHSMDGVSYAAFEALPEATEA